MIESKICNLRDFLTINSKYIQIILNQVTESSENKSEIHYNNNSKGFNINFTINYLCNKKENNIYFCEWYHEKNLKEEFISFIKDINQTHIEGSSRLFVFITHKDLKEKIDTICEEENINDLSNLKIVYIEDINDSLGGILDV